MTAYIASMDVGNEKEDIVFAGYTDENDLTGAGIDIIVQDDEMENNSETAKMLRQIANRLEEQDYPPAAV